MNYFGHYCSDAKDQNPLYNMGLVYPDLYRDQFKRFVIAHKNTECNPLRSVTPFYMGIKQHVKRDEVFHADPIFINAENQLQTLFDEYEISLVLPRIWFVKHVLVELLIDRNLVKRFPGKANAMHQDFEQVLKDHKSTFTRVLSTYEHQIFFNRLAKISQDKHIFAYLNNQTLIRTLFSIYNKVGIEIDAKTERNAAQRLEQIIQKTDNQTWLTWQI